MEKIRSYSVKNNNLGNSLKSIELGIYPAEPIKEENESVKDNLNESQDDDIINEEESEIHVVSNYQYYFELIISIIMCFNSFFSYSYLNIIHLIYCFLLIYSRYNIEYNFWEKSKKLLIIILLVIDILYLIVKSIFFIIYSVDNEVTEKCKSLYPYFVIGYEWRNYYDYSIVFIIAVLFIVYVIIGEFDEEFWKGSILTKT